MTHLLVLLVVLPMLLAAWGTAATDARNQPARHRR